MTDELVTELLGLVTVFTARAEHFTDVSRVTDGTCQAGALVAAATWCQAAQEVRQLIHDAKALAS